VEGSQDNYIILRFLKDQVPKALSPTMAGAETDNLVAFIHQRQLMDVSAEIGVVATAVAVSSPGSRWVQYAR
jgi:hypothetical protein